MSSQRRPAKAQLRRSLSEQLRDSTAKAWDLLWRNVRERRLAGLEEVLGILRSSLQLRAGLALEAEQVTQGFPQCSLGRVCALMSMCWNREQQNTVGQQGCELDLSTG
ncbi:rho GTPase-activating protein 7-like protein [Turdus rufiventris]|nr:rho GTPase-activating protein 7-like protein [Turdus rufiventris]